MKKNVSTLGTITLSLIMPAIAVANSAPKTPGTCYQFSKGNNSPTLTQRCLISSDWSSNTFVTVLHWESGEKTRIEAIEDNQTVNGVAADLYYRDPLGFESIGNVLPSSGNAVYCLEVKTTGQNICYRFTGEQSFR